MPHWKCCAAGSKEVGDERGFEVEGGSGKLEVQFEDADETRFVISPQTPVRQIWISALTTSFKLSWSDTAGAFVLEKTGETLMQLMGRTLHRATWQPRERLTKVSFCKSRRDGTT